MAHEIAQRHYTVLRPRWQRALKFERLYRGLMASGDEFISSSCKIAALSLCLPDLLAVEVAGAAQRYVFNIVKRLCAGLNSSIFPPYNAKY